MSKRITTLLGVVALGLAFSAGAQTAADHTQHHPAPANASAPGPATAAAQGMPAMPQMQQHMQEHMATMQALRNKLAAAKTPAEREALMGDHMKAMQEGMDMMKNMGGGKAPAGTASMDPSQRMQSMEMRMDMMQNMMDMMMQRMPATPSTK
jgi:hypothetical protein